MITAISDSNSSDDDLVAVVTNPTFTSRLAVPLYHLQQGTGTLQSTLTYKAVGQLQSLCFAANFLCGLVHDGTTRSVVIWNVTRGVAVHTLPETDDFQILDICTSSSGGSPSVLMVLIRKGSKLYVQEYSLDASTTASEATLFQMVRKIKAGKVEDEDQTTANDIFQVAAHDTRIAVRNGATVKVMERETGTKLYKCKLQSSQGGAAADSTSVSTVVMNENYVAVTTPSQIQVFTNGGKVKTTVIISERPTQLQLKGDYLLVDHSIYSILASATATPACTLTKSDADSRVQLAFSSDTEVRAIVQGPKGGVVTVCTMAFVEDEEILKTLELPKEEEDQGDEPSTVAPGKRPATTSLTQTLGPGQAGGESLEVSDRPIKKTKKAADDDEADEPTIAERLKRLQQVLDQEDEEEEIKFRPKQATTESLAHLLQQALSSADDSMLELALDVRDAKVRERSLDDLTVDQATLLLNKLTARLAKKASRASALVPWIQLVLLSGKIQSSAPLGPLKNLVQERVEVFPQLLQLEGRLSMLVNMS